MEKEFVPYEQSLELEKLGFDEECLGVYYTKDGDVRKCNECEYGDAPLYQQAFRWFRGKGFLIDISSHDKDKYEFYIGWFPTKSSLFKSFLSDIYQTYEEAELECLNKLIEIVKNKEQ